MAEERIVRLNGMDDGGEALPPWEAAWTLFGPIPNEGDTGSWPGKIGFSPLPLDGAAEIPAGAEILGARYEGVAASSPGGRLDLEQALGRPEGCPIAYAMTAVESPGERFLPIAFGADWGTQWWVNGALVYRSIEGNYADPDLVSGHQFLAPLRKGRNVIVVKVISGSLSWSISMAALPLRRCPGKASGTRGPRGGARPALPSSRDYCAAGLRIEERPGPVPVKTAALRERVLSESGTHAHWIGIVDPTGTPYAPSAFLPPGPKTSAAGERLLKAQAAEAHKRSMSVVTWFPGTYCTSAAEAHPEWKIVYLGGGPMPTQVDRMLCVNSPYGEALIGFTIESLAKYDLDGFWFDGTSMGHAGRAGCVCRWCAARFMADEGCALPAAVDWDDPVFRRWAAWRYRVFMEFWGRLAAEVRRSAPWARVAVNHLHRLGSGWMSAIPVDRYEADVVAGSESQDSPFVGAFHARQQRAYGRAQGEVWMGLHKLFTKCDSWPAEFEPVNRYLHHALCCLTAGVMPSFGTPDPAEKIGAACRAIGSVVNPRRGLEEGVPVPYAGLHLSQQSETFRFSRFSPPRPAARYWESVAGWHHLLMEKQLLQNMVFDAELTDSGLARYPIFVAPLSAALSDGQVRAFERYVAGGGVLAAGPGFGSCDEWGEPADPERVRHLLGRPASPPPAPEFADEGDASVSVRRVGRGTVAVFAGDAGFRFLKRRSALLADEVADLLRRAVSPPVEVAGPRRLHVGMFRREGRLLLHIQNFIAYSASERFPNPVLTRPEPARNVRVRLSGFPVRRVKIAAGGPAREIPFRAKGGVVSFAVPTIDWGIVLELSV